jgi:hypothetical protein
MGKYQPLPWRHVEATRLVLEQTGITCDQIADVLEAVVNEKKIGEVFYTVTVVGYYSQCPLESKRKSTGSIGVVLSFTQGKRKSLFEKRMEKS